jgi:hypothetical protein
MAGTTIDFQYIIGPDNLAVEISNKYTEWSMYRNKKIEQWKELRNYLYATDTTTTSNALLPWSNTTTTPKLTQIMDNLHANYFATLFPQQKWQRWEALDQDSGTETKRSFIQSYMDTKVRQSNFINTASTLLYDFIEYGNCFASVDFQRDILTRKDGTSAVNYIGPAITRISPYDIVFNPAAASFKETPKIIRSIKTLGELAKMAKDNPEIAPTLQKMLDVRQRVAADTTFEKADGFIADGFSSIQHYYGSNYVEILTFYGDMYDVENKELMEDRIITIVDRAFILDNKENPTELGFAPIFHAGWRTRPDNLYAMGPLDNLVGMQYRIDHLENLKADVFDQIAYPIMKIRGDVEDFDFEPGAKIYLGEEGDVAYLMPDATALQADFQINLLETKMEEMAGAPKSAMGIRTPGEKTAFEVQSLQNSASRIFEHKTAHFERTFLEPILNAMLEIGRQNLNLEEDLMVPSPTGEMIPVRITREDISGNGRIIPVGARHFAERARRVQNLTSLFQIKQSDPSVAVHLSGKAFAKIISDELGEPTLFGENIAIQEQMSTQEVAQDAEADAMEKQQIKADLGL